MLCCAIARTSTATARDVDETEHAQLVDEMIDVQGFLLRDCQASSKVRLSTPSTLLYRACTMLRVGADAGLQMQKLVEQAKLRAAALRQQLEAGKKVLLDALEAEKENLDKGVHVVAGGRRWAV
jgi:hypothetical protein